jgi:hypothetical protein
VPHERRPVKCHRRWCAGRLATIYARMKTWDGTGSW